VGIGGECKINMPVLQRAWNWIQERETMERMAPGTVRLRGPWTGRRVHKESRAHSTVPSSDACIRPDELVSY
jgi:hypothetical protein